MKSSVITFPGSNCDRDMDVALKKFGFKNKMVWHDDDELPKSDLVVLPGGFSYGDYLRCGCMASKSKIMKSVIITLKKDVLDPQGKVIQQTLDGMGFEDINEVRQGKYFEIDTKENDPKKAKDKVEEMCKKLLANLVIENYKIIDAQ